MFVTTRRTDQVRKISIRRAMFWLILIMPCASCMAQTEPRLDGHWWLLQSAEQRTAFFGGYYACYVYDVGFRDISGSPDPVRSVTNLYQLGAVNKHTPVFDAFKKIDAEGPRGQRRVASEKYGDTNGDYWRLSSKAERIEFVRGYLACQKLHFRVDIGKPLETYIDQLSAWYGIDDSDPGEIDSKTADDKVPAVLSRMLRN